jgi:predicted RND superfamily exporter protein
MGILGVPLNPANMIALPLILGISVDEGVHIVHDYLEHRGRYRMSHSTAVAVLVDTITTIVGFGSLMIASHRGLQSLGRVLTIGVSCCMFTSLIMLPALLTWMSWNRKDEEEELTPGGEHVRHSAATEGIIWRRDDAEFQGSAPHTAGERTRPNVSSRGPIS